MLTTDLRSRVLKKLETVSHDSTLQEVLSLLEFESDESEFILSDKQKSIIDEAQKQIKNGESFTNEEVSQEIETWLKG